MSKINFFCIIFCLSLFAFSLFIGGGAGLYYNTIAVLIVFPGIIGATFLAYPYERIKSACYVAYNTYTKKLKSPGEVINNLLAMNIQSRYEGSLSLEHYSKVKKLSFLDRAIVLLVDNYTDEEIKEVLLSEMQFFKIRRQQSERIFRHMANVSPAFGIAGSIIGLMSMINGLEGTDLLLENIPIALTSTFYGVILSYFFFIPLAESIHNRTQKELLLQRIIMSGIIAIRGEKNSYKLQTKLSSFVTPSDRKNIHFDFNVIRQKVSPLKKNIQQRKR